MTNNKNFRQVRALLTAGHALMTDADRALVRAQLERCNRDRAILLTVGLLADRFCDEINAGRDKLRTDRDPAILARVEMLEDAVRAVKLNSVGAVIELLLTKRVGLFMLPDPSDKRSRNDGIVLLGPDMRSANEVVSCVGAKLFEQNGAFFHTIKRGFSIVTEEVLIVRTLPFGKWDLDPHAKSEDAADQVINDVEDRCDMESGDWVSCLQPFPVCANVLERAYIAAIRTPSTDPAPAPRDRSF